MHRKPQHVKCPGCGYFSNSAGSLITHLEGGGCPNIKQQDFLDHVNHKHIISNLLDPGSTKNVMSVRAEEPAAEATSATSDTASEAGGVGIFDLMSNNPNEASQDNWWNTPKATQDWPTLEPVKSAKTDTISQVTNGITQVYLKSGDNPLGLDYDSTDDETEDSSGVRLRAKSSTKATTQSHTNTSDFTAALKQRESVYSQQHGASLGQSSVSSAPSMKPPPSQADSKTSLPGNKFTTRYWNPQSQYWNVENHFNTVINRYECPHPGCEFVHPSPFPSSACNASYTNSKYSWVTPSANELRHHCLTTHKITAYRCPSCLREFKDLGSLVRHCESASTRCGVRQTRNYAKFMDQITGGYVDASRTDPNGDVKYAASMPCKFEDKLPGEENKAAAWNAEWNGQSGNW